MLTLRLLLLVLVSAGFASAQTKARPNIVWLVAEDMSPWLGCYGDTTVPTPNCDRLAREGIRYANAFATSPVCAPARSSLITGMYATRIGTMQMRNNNKSVDEFVSWWRYDGIARKVLFVGEADVAREQMESTLDMGDEGQIMSDESMFEVDQN